MKSGLLWYDGDPQRSLEEKIGRAARRYRQKYGRIPTTCYVHPQAMNERRDETPGIAFTLDNVPATIRVVPASNILLHHFWLGESEPRGAGRHDKEGRPVRDMRQA